MANPERLHHEQSYFAPGTYSTYGENTVRPGAPVTEEMVKGIKKINMGKHIFYQCFDPKHPDVLCHQKPNPEQPYELLATIIPTAPRSYFSLMVIAADFSQIDKEGAMQPHRVFDLSPQTQEAYWDQVIALMRQMQKHIDPTREQVTTTMNSMRHYTNYNGGERNGQSLGVPHAMVGFHKDEDVIPPSVASDCGDPHQGRYGHMHSKGHGPFAAQQLFLMTNDACQVAAETAEAQLNQRLGDEATVRVNRRSKKPPYGWEMHIAVDDPQELGTAVSDVVRLHDDIYQQHIMGGLLEEFEPSKRRHPAHKQPGNQFLLQLSPDGEEVYVAFAPTLTTICGPMESAGQVCDRSEDGAQVDIDAKRALRREIMHGLAPQKNE